MSLRTSPQTGVAISINPGDCHVAALLAMTVLSENYYYTHSRKNHKGIVQPDTHVIY